jgi:hypothetical protein
MVVNRHPLMGMSAVACMLILQERCEVLPRAPESAHQQRGESPPVGQSTGCP